MIFYAFLAYLGCVLIAAPIVFCLLAVSKRADENAERILEGLRAREGRDHAVLDRHVEALRQNIDGVRLAAVEAHPAVEGIKRLLAGEEVSYPAAAIPVVADVKNRLLLLERYDRIFEAAIREGKPLGRRA